MSALLCPLHACLDEGVSVKEQLHSLQQLSTHCIKISSNKYKKKYTVNFIWITFRLRTGSAVSCNSFSKRNRGPNLDFHAASPLMCAWTLHQNRWVRQCSVGDSSVWCIKVVYSHMHLCFMCLSKFWFKWGSAQTFCCFFTKTRQAEIDLRNRDFLSIHACLIGWLFKIDTFVNNNFAFMHFMFWQWIFRIAHLSSTLINLIQLFPVVF